MEFMTTLPNNVIFRFQSEFFFTFKMLILFESNQIRRLDLKIDLEDQCNFLITLHFVFGG